MSECGASAGPTIAASAMPQQLHVQQQQPFKQQQDQQLQLSPKQQQRQEAQEQQSPSVGPAEMAAALDRLCQAASRCQQGARASTSGSSTPSRASPWQASGSKGQEELHGTASTLGRSSGSSTPSRAAHKPASDQSRLHHDAAPLTRTSSSATSRHASPGDSPGHQHKAHGKASIGSSTTSPAPTSPRHASGLQHQQRVDGGISVDGTASDADAASLSPSSSHAAQPVNTAQPGRAAVKSRAQAAGSTEQLLDALIQLEAQFRLAGPAAGTAGAENVEPVTSASEIVPTFGHSHAPAASSSSLGQVPLSVDTAAAGQEAAGANAEGHTARSGRGLGPESDSPAALMLEQLSSLPGVSATTEDMPCAGAPESTSQPYSTASVVGDVERSTLHEDCPVSTSSTPIPESAHQPPSSPEAAADRRRAVAYEPRAVGDSTAVPTAALPSGQEAGQDDASVANQLPGPASNSPLALGPKSVLDRLQRPSSAAMQSPNKSKYARSESREAGVKMADHPVGELACVVVNGHLGLKRCWMCTWADTVNASRQQHK